MQQVNQSRYAGLQTMIMLNANTINELSNAEIVHELGAMFRIYRIYAHMTQQEVAEQAGISVVTLRSFEGGKATNITMGNFLACLRAINQLETVADLLPEMPVSPYDIVQKTSNTQKRVRHGK